VPGRMSRDSFFEYTLEGRVSGSCYANRIGLVAFHPLSVRGAPVRVRTPDGTRQRSFPANISAWKPFSGFTGLTYTLEAVAVSITLDGEMLETEDQRNWTDASFKTYCPPLERGFPVAFRDGQSVSQRVLVRVKGPARSRSRQRVNKGLPALLCNTSRPSRLFLPALGTDIGATLEQGPPERVAALLPHAGVNFAHVVVESGRGGAE
jgi:hypothetical protein